MWDKPISQIESRAGRRAMTVLAFAIVMPILVLANVLETIRDGWRDLVEAWKK